MTAPPLPLVIDSLLLTATRIATFDGQRALTSASGFFFERDERLYLVTSRHVVFDEPSGHYPNRIEIEVHAQEGDLGKSVNMSLLLYKDGRSLWRQGSDTGGEIDVAVVELDRSAMPASAVLQAFTGIKPGVTALGLKEGGVDLAMDQHNAALVTPSMRARLDAARADIVSGRLKVIDYTAALRCAP